MANRCIVTISLGPELYKELQDYCESYGVNRSKLITIILKNYLAAVKDAENGRKEN